MLRARAPARRTRARSPSCSTSSRSARSRTWCRSICNNRVLVAQGLRRIRAGRCVAGHSRVARGGGSRARSVVAARISASRSAPRLNAAGRLEDMRIGIQCLLTDERRRGARARAAARAAQRRSPRARSADAAGGAARRSMRHARRIEGPSCRRAALFDAGWHQGVVGLVASRVKERVHRPVDRVRAAASAGWLKGRRARSPACTSATCSTPWRRAHPGLIEQFGGHAMAAGHDAARDRSSKSSSRRLRRKSPRHVDADALAGDLQTDGELEAGEFDRRDARMRCAQAARGARGFPEPLLRRAVRRRRHARRRRAASQAAAACGLGRSRRRDRVPALRARDAPRGRAAGRVR